MRYPPFLNNTEGNVTAMFAASIFAIIGVAGLAIDMIRAENMRANLNAAADAASLAAVSQIRESKLNSETKIAANAKAEAMRIWQANLTKDEKALIGTPSIAVTRVGQTWTTSVSYDAKLPTSLLRVLGVKDTPLVGNATATTGESGTFWDFTFAVDTSSSMGIGATESDMNAMQADSQMNQNPSAGTGCTFACHYSTTGDDTMAYARQAGYKLRIDVVADAVDATIDAIAAQKYLKSKAALYGMATDMTELVPKSASLDKVKDHKIDISFTPAFLGNSNYRASLEDLTDKVGAAGDGSSAAKARKIVFIIGDGLHDTPGFEPNVKYHWDSNHKLGPIDPAFCETMKQKEVLVGVLYVKYIVPPEYAGIIEGFKDDILPTMEACASPGFFHNATSAADMKTALNDMLQKAFKTDVRLSQ